MGLDSLVNISISRETAGVTQAGFGVPLILGPNALAGEIKAYSSLSAVAEDFETSDAEYKMAQALLSQTPRPERIKIGNKSTPVAQVVTYTPNVAVQEIHEYAVEIDGTEYAFTSDETPSAAEVVTGLKNLIQADANAKVTATGTTTLIVTADNAGEPFTTDLAFEAKTPGVLTTPSNGIAEDIQDAIDLDNDWYFLLTTAKDDTTVKVAAATIEALKKVFLFRNDDADVRTNATDDIVSILKGKNYFRTAVLYGDEPTEYGESGWVGRVAPLDPGSETWANKTIAALTADKWTDSEQNYLTQKNANFYITIAGLSVTQLGKTVGGEYIDVIRFIDWLTARMQERIFGDMAKLPKIPFTDPGIAIVEMGMRAVLQAGVSAGGIASSQDYTVTVPLAKNISSNDKAARRLTGMKFSAVLAGAIHATNIQGTISL